MSDLSIVSNHPHLDKSVFDTDDEIWVFNKRGTDLPRFDVLFQVHKPEVWRPLHEAWLQANTTYPVYMLEKYPDVPMAIPYPIREAIALTRNITVGPDGTDPLHFLPFSITLALALAILQHRPKIKVWGVTLHKRTEYFVQRIGYAFWVGFAAGRGIELEIHEIAGQESIFKNDIYPLSIADYIEGRLMEGGDDQ